MGEAGFQSPGGPPGGGAGENPPGRHPEWLISADESLFSFRLNTLNRAPSDVYLHSLRANAGEGRGAGATRRLGGLAGSSGPPPQRGREGISRICGSAFPAFPELSPVQLHSLPGGPKPAPKGPAGPRGALCTRLGMGG